MANAKQPDKAREELGKWLMDISKYVLIAVMISYLFSDINNNPWQILLGAVVVLITLFTGMRIINNSTTKKRK